MAISKTVTAAVGATAGAVGTVPMLSEGAKTVKAGKTCAQLWVNGQRKAVQCHYITK
ncbi:hypothetical protein ACH4YO_32580 [Streptomyces noursei]|uniref:hypothetical protein n=1 Tax=Streptomyces noursei TaxID=1971 RepID=UPI00340ED62B